MELVGLSLMFVSIAGKQTDAAFTRQWFNVLGLFLLVAVVIGMAVVGVPENRNIRAAKSASRALGSDSIWLHSFIYSFTHRSE